MQSFRLGIAVRHRSRQAASVSALLAMTGRCDLHCPSTVIASNAKQSMCAGPGHGGRSCPDGPFPGLPFDSAHGTPRRSVFALLAMTGLSEPANPNLVIASNAKQSRCAGPGHGG